MHSLKRWLALVCALALGLACTGCGSPAKTDLTVLTIATADNGGTMYPVGSAIAEVLSDELVKVNVSASTGSTMNVQSLIDGEADLALVSGDAAYEAWQTPEGEDLRAIAAVYVSVSNWVAPIETGAVYVHDLAGMRLGIGPQSSATDMTARTALQALGLDQSEVTLVNCGLGAGTNLVLEGELDAVHGFTGAPIGGLSDLAEQTPSHVLLYTQDELEAILRSNSLYVDALVPAGTYEGQNLAVRTFGVKCLLCVDASADEDLIFSLTHSLWEGRETLVQVHPCMEVMKNGNFLCEDIPIPLHSGADRFYTDME